MTKFKEQAAKILKILRVFDKNGLISLTNLTLMLVMYKVFSTPALNMQDISILLVGLLSYQSKKLIGSK